MICVERHIISKQHKEFKKIDNLCFLSKNLYNVALYTIKILIVVVVVLVCGCSFDIERWQITESEEKCEEHGGIYKFIPETGLNYLRVVCEDGTIYRIKNKQLKD
jgi:hypothetical protein